MTPGQLPQLRRQLVEGSLGLGRQGLSRYFPVLILGRASMPPPAVMVPEMNKTRTRCWTSMQTDRFAR